MSRSIKSVLLVIHPTRNEALVSAAELTKLFLDKKIDVYATLKISGAKDYTDKSKVDLALVLGGDGTMLIHLYELIKNNTSQEKIGRSLKK